MLLSVAIADIRTTVIYIEASMERKRKALEKLPSPESESSPEEAPRWKQPELMRFLNKCSRKARYVA